MTNLNEIEAILRRAQARSRIEDAEKGGELMADMFADSTEKAFRSALGTGNDERRRDEMRSELAAMRHNELLMKDMFGELSPEESGEAADLASRRDDFGYYRPGPE